MFEYRAEVGLLTRNVVVKGSEAASWQRDIEACADGFNPGKHAFNLLTSDYYDK